MSDLEQMLPPVERHYAKLLAALCRSTRAKPAEQRVLVMRGIVRSIGGNSEPERTEIVNLVLLELSTPDEQDLSEDLSKLISGGIVSSFHLIAPSVARVTLTRERRRHLPGEANSIPWHPTRERRLDS